MVSRVEDYFTVEVETDTSMIRLTTTYYVFIVHCWVYLRVRTLLVIYAPRKGRYEHIIVREYM